MEWKFKKRINWLVLITLVIYELFVFFFVFIFTYAAITEIIQEKEVSELLTISILIILLGIVVLNLILWQITGYEHIEINDKTLTIKKKGKLFVSKKIINLFEIEQILLKNHKTTTYATYFLVKPLGLRGGKICIKYLGRNVYIGQDITDKQALECVNELNKRLADYKNKHKV